MNKTPQTIATMPQTITASIYAVPTLSAAAVEDDGDDAGDDKPSTKFSTTLTIEATIESTGRSGVGASFISLFSDIKTIFSGPFSGRILA
jgi:hypothetical protein